MLSLRDWDRAREITRHYSFDALSSWVHVSLATSSCLWPQLSLGRDTRREDIRKGEVDLRACARTRSWAEAPTPDAVGQLIKKTTEDPDWFPGKIYGSLGGRPPLVSETNKSIMANSAMAMKERGIEPTCSSIIARCPNASINPIAGEPISRQVVHDILENRCYDI